MKVRTEFSNVWGNTKNIAIRTYKVLPYLVIYTYPNKCRKINLSDVYYDYRVDSDICVIPPSTIRLGDRPGIEEDRPD